MVVDLNVRYVRNNIRVPTFGVWCVVIDRLLVFALRKEGSAGYRRSSMLSDGFQYVGLAKLKLVFFYFITNFFFFLNCDLICFSFKLHNVV